MTCQHTEACARADQCLGTCGGQIVRDTAGQYFRVRELLNPDLAHCWMGKPTSRKGVDRKGPARLVRKAGCTVVEG